jgi:ribonuclease Z
MIEILVLGSGGSIPEEGRNHPAIAIRYRGWVLLLDAGEDVQRRWDKAKLGLNKNTAVFISHMHADHILGLPGLLLRFSLLGRIKPLTIYGPPELIEYVKVAQSTINLGTTFETTVYGVRSGVIFEQDEITVSAFEVDHRGYALGYHIRWQRPTGTFLPEKAEALGVPKGHLWNELADGKDVTLKDGSVIRSQDVTNAPPPPLNIVYSGDTRPCKSLVDESENANVLICEGMYTNEHMGLAAERGHSTSTQAAQLAKDSNVRLLVLTHYSPRYYDGSIIIEEAKEVFPNSVLARDGMKITLHRDGSYEITDPAW